MNLKSSWVRIHMDNALNSSTICVQDRKWKNCIVHTTLRKLDRELWIVSWLCCSIFFSKMYENNPLKIADDKQSQQYKWLLNIVDLQQLIETKPAKILIYATIIVKKQKRNSNNSNHSMETRYRRNSCIITPVRGTNICYQFLAILKHLQLL